MTKYDKIDTDNYRQMTTDHEKQWQMGIWFLSQHAPFPMDYWRMVSIIWWPWWPSFCGWISEDLGCWIWLVALPFSVWCFGSALGCASHEVRVLYNSPHVTATYSIWKKMLCQGYWQGIYSRVYLNPWGRDLSPIPLHFLAWLINFPAGGCPSVWSHGTWLWITGGMHIQALEWVAGCVRILEHPGEN